jgi:hypothetical protein
LIKNIENTLSNNSLSFFFNFNFPLYFCKMIKIVFNPTCHNLNIRFTTKCGVQSTWGQKSVCENETHSYTWGRVQKIEPNDFQVHSHFGSCTTVEVLNILNLS